MLEITFSNSSSSSRLPLPLESQKIIQFALFALVVDVFTHSKPENRMRFCLIMRRNLTTMTSFSMTQCKEGAKYVNVKILSMFCI